MARKKYPDTITLKTPNENIVDNPKPIEPKTPCHTCGSTNWWWRQNKWAPRGGWLCSICQPKPQDE